MGSGVGALAAAAQEDVDWKTLLTTTDEAEVDRLLNANEVLGEIVFTGNDVDQRVPRCGYVISILFGSTNRAFIEHERTAGRVL